MSFINLAKLTSKKSHKKEAKRKPKKSTRDARDRWFESEGKINIDLFKVEENLVIRSTIAGIDSDDIDISIEGDMIGIRGVRKQPSDDAGASYFHQECYWGAFSRQIILPEEIDPSRAEAKLENGILTITVPCVEREKKRTLEVR